ncbi:MAG: HD domain-containing protein [Butyrivibrio sp.]|nr:HD domain-containing protein [Butyrivibrio sp.]
MLYVLANYYWPRFIVSLLFVLFSLNVIKDRYSIKEQIKRGFILFFVSSPIISMIAEILNHTVNTFIIQRLFSFNSSTANIVFIAFSILCDFASLILPIYIFSKIIGENMAIAATMYIEFTLQDRFALILSTNAISYIIVYVIALIILVLVHSSDVMYISQHIDSLKWWPVLLYNLMLLALMDICYGAYFFFDELQIGTLNVQKIWLDMLLVVCCLFAASFSKLNVIVSKEHDHKIEYMKKFQDNQSDIIRDFATISEAKSGETGQHIRRVSEYTAILAKPLLENEDDVSYIKIASMMHDIGKLMIPNEIIEKPGKLTPEEYEIIKTHSTYGENLLSHNQGEIMTMARSIAYEHHEKWDGTGYPRGLKGDEISLVAQIVAVADVYDALTSRRSYKEPWNPEDAKAEIINQKGRQFSPSVVDVFEKNYAEIDNIRQTYAD